MRILTVLLICLLMSLAAFAGGPKNAEKGAGKALASSSYSGVDVYSPAGPARVPHIHTDYLGRWHYTSRYVDIEARHFGWRQVSTGLPGVDRVKGGPLGGELERFNSSVEINVVGKGEYAGFNRTIVLNAETVTATGPTNSDDKDQAFENQMVRLEANLEGDADFDFLKITAGTGNGLDSSGFTQITSLGNDNYNIQSTFNIAFSLEFQASANGGLAGLADAGVGEVTMRAHEAKDCK
ncbi:MAG: hypothetical protein QNK37_23980 [Acidobacteriota bacterium]|nr:hypothetical protein [Acidobacteriota bacterium]